MAPGRKFQIIHGKTIDVDTEIASLGLLPRDAKAMSLANMSDVTLAEKKDELEATLAKITAEQAKRIKPKEIAK